jgi:excisionase family DNA binding protein
MGEKMYSVGEVAEVLGLSPATVRSYCSQGKIPAKKVGRSYQISPKVLQDWAVSSKKEFKYKTKDGTVYKVEICSLAQPGEPRPSFFYIFANEDNAFFVELLITSEFPQKDTIGLNEILSFIYQAIDSDVREPKRIIVGKDGVSYEDLVPDMEMF